MTKRISRRVAASALFTTMAAGCGVERIGPDDVGTGTGDGPVAEVPVWVQTAFDRSCATPGCHVPGGSAVSLAPGDSAAAIGGSATQSDLPLIELGNVEGSYLALKMLPEELLPAGVSRAGSQMPIATSSEGDEDVDIILGWIASATADASFHQPPNRSPARPQ
ncbi:MAG: hypothetical protein B7733_04730 [Myxococcales bacterium FL481]|nr:MAG: hypothetical protein B7733_04730 [Myxococcales bacterium FL481]